MREYHILIILVLFSVSIVGAHEPSRDIKLPFPEYIITVADNSTKMESFAANELSNALNAIFNVEFPVVSPAEAGSRPQLAVGPGASLLLNCVTQSSLARLGWESFILHSVNPHLCITGGVDMPRGTIYAVQRLLFDIGVRYYATDMTLFPAAASISDVPVYNNLTFTPTLEYRDHNQMRQEEEAFDVHNHLNGASSVASSSEGGHYTYAGGMFVHTYYQLVPPDKYFSTNPEWFSLIDGKRTATNAQLCLTNETLLDFVVEEVRGILKANPESKIISISQNDHNGGNCQCDKCQAAEKAAGGNPSGPVLSFVNSVAGSLKDAFPDVAFDTLAYQYTRTPPVGVVPADNVIVRLCSIECNFAKPFNDSSNARFAQDLKGWSGISERLYIWDYVTDFGGYVQPFPNWFVIGPNIKFLADHSVKGVFEEGTYQSKVGEMVPLKGYLMSRMMWEPNSDPNEIIEEFLISYYDSATPYILKYMDTFEESINRHNFYLKENSPVDSAFLDIKTLSTGALLLQNALVDLNGKEPYTTRVKIAVLPVFYVFLRRWKELCITAHLELIEWVMPESADSALDWFTEVFQAAGGTVLDEAGHDLSWLRGQIPAGATCRK